MAPKRREWRLNGGNGASMARMAPKRRWQEKLARTETKAREEMGVFRIKVQNHFGSAGRRTLRINGADVKAILGVYVQRTLSVHYRCECQIKKHPRKKILTHAEVCSKHSASRQVPVKNSRRTQKMWTERKTMSDQQTQDPRGTLYMYLENPQKSDHGPPPKGSHGLVRLFPRR
jgi:hypothetical protein